MVNRIYHVHHKSNPTQEYTNTNVAIARDGKTRNNISRDHNNRSRRNNQPVNRDLANFTGEVPSDGPIFGRVVGQSIMIDQCNTFHDQVKKYVLRKFDDPRDITIVIRDQKDPYAHVGMYNPINFIE